MSCVDFTVRDDIKALFPGLVEAAYLIGSTQVQGRCSIGGNLCNASPAADTIPALIANGAICQIMGAGGSRDVPVEEFVTGVGQNCLADDELLASIRIPKPAANTADAYLRFIPRTEWILPLPARGQRHIGRQRDSHRSPRGHWRGGNHGLVGTCRSGTLIGTDLNDAAYKWLPTQHLQRQNLSQIGEGQLNIASMWLVCCERAA